jgi:hypothetical protein
MVELSVSGLRHDSELQLIQADVRFAIDGDVLVEEAVCFDVGLPSLLNSGLRDMTPDRWADPHDWERVPFFICGCGDPDCRAFSFVVEHSGETIRLTEVQERQGAGYRTVGEYELPATEYREALLQAGRQFLAFVEGRDYRPYLADTVSIVHRLVAELEAAVSESGD